MAADAALAQVERATERRVARRLRDLGDEGIKVEFGNLDARAGIRGLVEPELPPRILRGFGDGVVRVLQPRADGLGEGGGVLATDHAEEFGGAVGLGPRLGEQRHGHRAALLPDETMAGEVHEHRLGEHTFRRVVAVGELREIEHAGRMPHVVGELFPHREQRGLGRLRERGECSHRSREARRPARGPH